MIPDGSDVQSRTVGRYVLYDEIAAGGMATVHLGKLLGAVGFSRTVAIKCLHAQFAKDPEFVSMFLDEARLAARIRDPNVIATLDVVALKGEVFLVMEYVQGESLATLLRALGRDGGAVEPSIAVAIIVGVLHGLAAAHAAKGERGEPLRIVHRDVSPQNILVGIDGVARLLDFGVAKAVGRLQTTREGQIKGKCSYMAPEQVRGKDVDARTDLYAAAVVLWEALVGKRLFTAETPVGTMSQVIDKQVAPPSERRAEISKALDAVVLRGLTRDPEKRFQTAIEMVEALEKAYAPATTREVKAWVEALAGPALLARAEQVARVEGDVTPPSQDGALILAEPAVEIRASAATPEIDIPIEMTTTEAPAIKPHPKKIAPVPLIVALVLGAIIAFVAFMLGRAPTTIAREEAPPASSPLDAEIEVLAVEPALSSSSDGPPGALSAKPRAPSTHPRVVHAPPLNECDPPFTVDRGGIRRPKPKCF